MTSSTSEPTHASEPRTSRRDQLTAAVVVGGVVVVLGLASGVGIATTTSAAVPRIAAITHRPAGPSATTSAGTTTPPTNYIGVPGPGTGGGAPALMLPGVPTLPTARTTPTTTAAGTRRSTTPTSTTPAPVTMSCPSDIVTSLLRVLTGANGVGGLLNGSALGAGGLLSVLTNIIPNLTSLLSGLGTSSPLTTPVASLSGSSLNSMAAACTPVMSGLLGLGGAS